MNAWLLDKLDGISNLQLRQVPDPVPGSGEVLLAIDIAALNPADRHLANNQYPAKPTLPHILGRDGIGSVVAVGNSVSRFKVGDRAIVLRSEIGVNRPGTFAEKVAVPEASLAAVPAGWSDEESAGAALVYLTAYQALTQWGPLPQSVVLITGASGGVGAASHHLAVAGGHTVVALSRNPEKRDKLKSMGASFCYDPQDKTWPAQLKSALGERRVDLAIDSVAGEGFGDVISTLGYNGKMSLVGRSAGAVPQFNTGTLFFRRLKIGGVAVGTYTPAESQAAWKSIVETMQKANVKPLVDSIFPFDRLLDAFAKLEKGPMGKVLLKIRG